MVLISNLVNQLFITKMFTINEIIYNNNKINFLNNPNQNWCIDCFKIIFQMKI